MLSRKITKKCTTGFTLVEMLVSLSLFTIIAVISLSSLIAVLDANRKAQALKSVMNNLNFVLESMERTIRVGYNYHCELDANPTPFYPPATLATTKNCAANGKLFAFESSKGNVLDNTDQIVYRINGEKIETSKNSGVDWAPLTVDEIKVEDLTFTVGGALDDNEQPFVVITLRASTGSSAKVSTVLSVQTAASQRAPDF